MVGSVGVGHRILPGFTWGKEKVSLLVLRHHLDSSEAFKLEALV